MVYMQKQWNLSIFYIYNNRKKYDLAVQGYELAHDIDKYK